MFLKTVQSGGREESGVKESCFCCWKQSQTRINCAFIGDNTIKCAPLDIISGGITGEKMKASFSNNAISIQALKSGKYGYKYLLNMNDATYSTIWCDDDLTEVMASSGETFLNINITSSSNQYGFLVVVAL